VSLAVAAAETLAGKGRKVRVVSMPSTSEFDKQDAAYRESVLPAAVTARVAVEAGVTDYWARYVGLDGKVVGIDTFGESAPAGEVYKHFGITAENVAKAVESLL
jgi:transketolase